MAPTYIKFIILREILRQNLVALLKKPELVKFFVNDKLKLHNGARHTYHYAKIMIHTLVAHFVTKPLIIRYEKKELIFKKKKKMI